MIPTIPFAIADRVRCEHEAPDRGSWCRYTGKVGTVTSIKRPDREVGVVLDGREGVVVWFRPDELVAQKAETRPYKAPTGRSRAELVQSAGDWP